MWKLFLAYNATDTQESNETVNILPSYQGVSIDILYNELFFYTLFAEVYDKYLERYRNNDKLLPQALQGINITSAIATQRTKIKFQNKKLAESV